jgi:hypothetical protein
VDGRSVFQARNCDSNSYGVSKISYGRTVFPCRECANNMITSTDKINFPNSASHFVDNGDGIRGFVNVNACVTRAGFGYASRQSDMCAEGTYNDKDSYDICKPCPFGTTTAGVGLGVTVDDCKLARGFGFHDGRIGNCPVGKALAQGSTSAFPPALCTGFPIHLPAYWANLHCALNFPTPPRLNQQLLHPV